MDQYPIDYDLPEQQGNSGKFLTTDGQKPSWAPVSETGTQSYITENNEQATLPNSRRLSPGPNISFADDGTNLIISSAGASSFTILPVASGGTGLSSLGSSDQVLAVTHTGSGLEYKTVAPGSGMSITPSAGQILIACTGVTSVGLSLPAIFNVSGSPVTTTGTLTAVLATEASGTVFAGPTSGASIAPSFRPLAVSDLPLSFPLATASGGTGGTTAVNSISNLDGTLVISPIAGSVIASVACSINLTGNPTTTTPSSTDNSTKIATTAFVSNNFGYGPIPSAWTDVDVGSVATAGGSTYNPYVGSFLIYGNGGDFNGTADIFHYVYQTVSGNHTIICRVKFIQGQYTSNQYARCGLMVRQSTDVGAINMDTCYTGPNQSSSSYNRNLLIQYRSTLNAAASTPVNVGGLLMQTLWLKIVVSGSTVTGYSSVDGQNWNFQSSSAQTISFSGSYLMGLCITGQGNSSTSQASCEIDNVSIT